MYLQSKMKKINLHIILLFVYVVTDVNAITDKEMKIKMVKEVMKCTKDHPVDLSDLFILQSEMRLPEKREVKCLLACAYRRIGTMDKNGMYNLEAGYKLAEESKNGDEKRLANAKKLADICMKVNEETVSDGDEGCDRAAHMFKCLVENAAKLGFDIN